MRRRKPRQRLLRRARCERCAGELGASVCASERGARVCAGERGARVCAGERGASVWASARSESVCAGERGASVLAGERAALRLDARRRAAADTCPKATLALGDCRPSWSPHLAEAWRRKSASLEGCCGQAGRFEAYSSRDAARGVIGRCNCKPRTRKKRQERKTSVESRSTASKSKASSRCLAAASPRLPLLFHGSRQHPHIGAWA